MIWKIDQDSKLDFKVINVLLSAFMYEPRIVDKNMIVTDGSDNNEYEANQSSQTRQCIHQPPTHFYFPMYTFEHGHFHYPTQIKLKKILKQRRMKCKFIHLHVMVLITMTVTVTFHLRIHMSAQLLFCKTCSFISDKDI